MITPLQTVGTLLTAALTSQHDEDSGAFEIPRTALALVLALVEARLTQHHVSDLQKAYLFMDIFGQKSSLKKLFSNIGPTDFLWEQS